METTTTDVPRVDLYATAMAVDPYPTLAEWRAQGPLVHGGARMWGVTRHEDVSRRLKDRRVGHHMPREYLEFVFGKTEQADFQFNSILNRDPPDHTRLRRLMSQAFSRSLVQQLRPWVTAIVDELLVPLRERTTVDVVGDLAFPLPSQVICELLGLADADRDEIGRVAVKATSRDRGESNDAVIWLRTYISDALDGRRPDTEGDLLQRMLAAEDGDDALTHAEIVDNAALLFFAGFETTKHLISAGCAALVANQDQRARLWATPAGAPTAVEEFLRYDTAVASVHVFVHEPVEIGDHTLGEGEVLFLLLPSANHDERVFDRPDRLDVGRDPNPHVGFGGGLHLCLGAMLARLEADVVFTRLAETTATIEQAGAVERTRGGLGGIARVPITAVPR